MRSPWTPFILFCPPILRLCTSRSSKCSSSRSGHTPWQRTICTLNCELKKWHLCWTSSQLSQFLLHHLSWKSHSSTMAMCSFSTLPLGTMIRLRIKCYEFRTSQKASPCVEKKQFRECHLALEPFSYIDTALPLLITSQGLFTNWAEARQAASELLLACLEHFLACLTLMTIF